MSDTFVPLATSAAGGPDATTFRLKILPQQGSSANFQPLALSGRIPGHDPHSPDNPPSVELKREGDRIVGLRIQCSCGQLLELSFEF
jgi:hypothetical protein